MNTVRHWLGWPEWIVVIAQTPLLIGVSFSHFSDDFRQFSANIGFRVDLEEILGIVAITTFLVGFSSVRLQSILEERKDGEARRIDRVLEQNAGKDLLPLPSSLGRMDTTQDSFFKDKTTFFTILLTWLNFVIASVLIGVHQVNSDLSPIPFWLVQIVHFFIVLIGTFGPKFVRRQFSEYQTKQPFYCYRKMMVEIQKVLDGGKDNMTLKQTISNFDASVPEWSWLTLIRCFQDANEKDNAQLKRIYDLVEPQKDADDYSLIAFVWSAYLLDNGEPDSISRIVRYSEIEKILKFGNPKSPPFPQSEKSPEKRDVLKKFLDSTFDSYENPSIDDASKVNRINAQTFARLTVTEILRVWDQPNKNGTD